MTIKLYGSMQCPSARAALLTAKAIGLELEFISVDVFKGEQLSQDYLKKNPQHTIPTIDDNGFIMWDSHAIMMYFVDKYGKNDSMYPKDLAKRTTVNRLLFFEAGEIFASHKLICISVLKENGQIPAEPLENLKKALGFLENFLQKSKYVAGNDMTIADFSIWTTLSNARNWLSFDENIYPNIAAWQKRLDSLPYAQICYKGAKEFEEKVKLKMRNDAKNFK